MPLPTPFFRHLCMASAIACTLVSTPFAHADYFLHTDQRLELIRSGQIMGEDHTLYAVWIVPGYVPPWNGMEKYWGLSKDQLSQYTDSSFYSGIGDDVHSIIKFDRHQVIQQFIFHGINSDWSEDLHTAQDRTERRVFGWWLAYPWAYIELTAKTTIRTVAGSSAAVLIGVLGPTVWPVIEFSAPAVVSVFYATIPGTTIPLLEMSWNTVIAPPLALLGQQPSATRADGFWIKPLSNVEHDPSLHSFITNLKSQDVVMGSLSELQAIQDNQTYIYKKYEQQRSAFLDTLRNNEDQELKQNSQRQQDEQLKQRTLHPDQYCQLNQLRAQLAHYSTDQIIHSLTETGMPLQSAQLLILDCTSLLGQTPPTGKMPASGD